MAILTQNSGISRKIPLFGVMTVLTKDLLGYYIQWVFQIRQLLPHLVENREMLK